MESELMIDEVRKQYVVNLVNLWLQLNYGSSRISRYILQKYNMSQKYKIHSRALLTHGFLKNTKTLQNEESKICHIDKHPIIL